MRTELTNSMLEKVEEFNIYKATYKGIITIEDFIQNIDAARKLDLPQDVCLINDYRQATFKDINTQIIEDLVAKVQEASNDYRSLQIAFIHENPRDQVMSELFRIRASKIKGLHCKIFCTLEGALQWFGKV